MALADRIVVMNIARVAAGRRAARHLLRAAHPLRGRVHRDDQPPERPGAGRPAGPAGGQHPRAGALARRGRTATSSFFPARAREPGRPRAGAPAGDRGGLLLHGRPDAADHHGPGGRLPHDRNRGHAIVPQGAAGGGPGGAGRAAAPGRMRGRPAWTRS
ncbi:MAG: hypothetical protein MZU91_07740 [Desulfosudis oleivorans]|nr:hypothetical protein [Desulfosudis oleivorans]